MNNLKTELLHAQKTRDDLMKWKLMLVSGIGAAGLGFSNSTSPKYAELAICLIPFACVYVDLLCRNLSIRTKSISAFISSGSSSDSVNLEILFERFYALFDSKRKAMEGMAFVYSTIVLSVAITMSGILIIYTKKIENVPFLDFWPSLLFIASGVGGILFSWVVEFQYKGQNKKLKEALREWEQQHHGSSNDSRDG